ncbi:MAG: glycosyltransferase family 1 protein [Spirochaetales bacterium]|nr:glycosyltransferase family 1 protein [Spirochaetales bacterium]
MPRILIISPPFYSHAQPLLALGEAFRAAGWDTIVACGPSFAEEVSERGLRFVELPISRNANVGAAGRTRQPREEQQRLEAFLAATRAGAVETLLLQARDRQADMLFDPGLLRERISGIDAREHPDLWIVDQLSYGVTVALHSLSLRYVTYNPGHPRYIPTDEDLFGVPHRWPAAFAPDPTALQELRRLCREVEELFTSEFNRFLKTAAPGLPPVGNAFRLASPEAVLFNYPELPTVPKRVAAPAPPGSAGPTPRRIYLGSCFKPATREAEVRRLLGSRERSGAEAPRILIVMGTFLAARTDVLERCIRAALAEFPEARIIAAAGAHRQALAHLASEQVRVEEFVPQTALLPHVDLVVHHGGNNSFTECLYYGRPMVILPFSSDQFNIAFDAETAGLAEVADPNAFGEGEMRGTLRAALGRGPSLERWRGWVRARGPAYAVRELERRVG